MMGPKSSERRTAVLNLYADGYSYQDIADELQMGFETVREHLRRAKKEHGLSRQRDLIPFINAIRYSDKNA